MSAEYDHGSAVIGRRDFAKAVGAAGAIGAGTAASSTTVTAASSPLLYNPVSPTLAGLALARGVADWSSGLTKDVEADESIMHSIAVSEYESLQAHYVTFGNHLEDTNTIAMIDSRQSIATDWENGVGSTQAYNNAMAAVNGYYGGQEVNHLETLTKGLHQFSHITHTAHQSDTIADDFLHLDPPQYYDMSDDTSVTVTHVKNVIAPSSDAVVSVDYTLKDGSTHTVETPELVFETDEYGQLRKPLTQTVIDSYDSGNNVFKLEFPNAGSNGLRLETSLAAIVMNVGSELDSRTVMRPGGEWMDLYNQVSTQADNVVANYDEAFVEDLYAAMDNGTISPSDVRGAAAQARWMSGTDDVTADSYKMAVLQQLDMSQADLSQTASMTVNYSGFTERNVLYDDSDNRHVHPNKPVSDKTYQGLMFAEEPPANGFEVGKEYLLDPHIYVSDSSGTATALDAGSGSEMWAQSVAGDSADLEISPDGATLYYVSGSTLHAVNTTDRTERWTYSLASGGTAVSVSDDGSTIYVADDGSTVYAVSSDGTEQWTASVSRAEDIELSPDGSTLYCAAFGSGNAVALNTSDGTQKWSVAMSGSPNSVAVHPDGSTVYVGFTGGGLDEIAVSDQTTTTHTFSGGNKSSAVVTDDGTLYLAANSPPLVAVDTSDMTEMWTHSASIQDSNGFTVEVMPDGMIIVTSSGGVATVLPDGSAGPWAFDMSATTRAAVAPQPGNAVGVAGNAVMYDAESGSEIPMQNGRVTITKMTDRDGNEVKATTWEQPKYDAYDSSEYASYVEKTKDFQVDKWTKEPALSGGGGGGFFSTLGNGVLLGLGILAGGYALLNNN